MTNNNQNQDNKLPPLPELPVPETSNIRLKETGEFNVWTNLNEIGSITRNWSISYERLKDSNPDSPSYQLFISSGVGTVAETLTRISTSASYEIGLSKLFKALKIAVGAKTGTQIEVFTGEIKSANNTDGAVYRYINKTGIEANELFSDMAQNGFDNFLGNPNSDQGSNQSSVSNKFNVVVESTNSQNQTTSITATKTINPSNNKSSISVSSNDYDKKQLSESSKSLIQNESENLVGSKITIEGNDGVLNTTLIDNSLKTEFDKFLNTELSFNEDLKISDNLYLVEDNNNIILKDNSTTTLGTILDSIESAAINTSIFITNRVEQATDIVLKQITSDSFTESLIGNIVSDLILGQHDIKEIAKNLAEGQLKNLASSILDDSFRDLLKESGISEAAINNALGEPAAGYIVNQAGIRIPVDEAGNVLPITSINATLYSAVLNFAISAADSSGWNSQEYVQAAKTAVVSAVVTAAVTAVLTIFFPGIGTAAGIIISSVINALIVVPLVNYYDNQYELIENAFIIVRDITKDLIRDPINTIEDLSIEDLSEQAKELSIDLVENFGKLGRDVLIGAYNLIGQDYGKKYSAGQYENPYSFSKITPKLDGTGNIIVGFEREGVIIEAADGRNDDLFGTEGQDSLIGKSGKNTIYGYAGNDHIEGRNDDDILVGGDGNDEIFGGNGDDYLGGGDGDDQIDGGNGDDSILAGNGSDLINGGKGNDQIEAEDSNDYVLGGDGDDIILGGLGNDIIEGENGNDIIYGEDGEDLILGGAGNDSIEGGAGADIIKGGDGNNNLVGGDGADEIYGGSGTDIIYGDAGNDIISAGTSDDLAFGGIGNDIIFGAAGDDSLYGEIGNDYILGGEGNDIIDGFSDDDVIMGGLGNDNLTGGTGNDTFIFFENDGQDIIDDSDEVGSDVIKLADLSSTLTNGSNRLVLSKDGSDLVIKFNNNLGEITSDKITVKNHFFDGNDDATLKVDRIEFSDGKKINLSDVFIDTDGTISYSNVSYINIDTDIQTEIASGYEDILSIDSSEINSSSSFYANNYDTTANQDQIDNEKYNEVQWQSIKKNRSIFGGSYRVWEKYYEKNLSGSNANDRIVGNWWSENIFGKAGDDQLSGNDGNDTIHAGSGDDLILGGGGEDRLFGEAGNDKIYGGTQDDYIEGGDDNDNLIGGSGSDTILGQAGDDLLEGNEGDDNLILGSGNNIAYGGGGNENIVGSSGNDLVYGQDGNDNINAGAGDDFISGGSGNDILDGEDGNDNIFGDLGNDRISGNQGIDYIYGGKGFDNIWGGDGNDTIYGGEDEDLISGGSGDDKIHGDAGSDNIKGDAGDDKIYGDSDGDVIDGGVGNDKLFGGTGNDILIDGAGSDTLGGGAEKDILILTKEDGISSSIDTINNFSASEDRIILKVNYQSPITFAEIQAAMIQDGTDTKITLNNGQQIIITNTQKSDITMSNFSIGLSGGEGNQILFGTSSDDVVMGDAGDDTIYGGEGNDELWGGLGADALYG